MEKVKTLKKFYEIVESDDISVFYFYTNWCPDCFRVNFYKSKLINEYENIKFYQVNRDELVELSSHLGIFGIPSFLMYKSGEELGRFVSKLGKSYVEVKDFINNSL